MIALFLPIVFAVVPPLNCPAPVADAGAVRSGPPLVQIFRLTNTHTEQTIRILGLDAGCGCLRRDLDRERLAPGETAELRVAVNTLTQPEGPNTWRIGVRYQLEPTATGKDTPSPEQSSEQRLELTVAARLVREISVTPPAVAFSTTGAARQTLFVTDRRNQPFTLTRAVTTSEHLTATLGEVRTVDGVRQFPVELSLAASMPVGEARETVVLTTNDPACLELRVPITVVRRSAGAVTATPARLELSAVSEGVPVSRLVQFRAGGQPVRIQSVEPENPAVTVKWASPGGPVATLRVTVAGGATGESTIRVRFTEPAGAELRIPVRWSARP